MDFIVRGGSYAMGPYLNIAAAADDNILASTVGGGGHLAIAGGHQVHIDVGAHQVTLTCLG